MRPGSGRIGYVLLELLIALAIFTLLAAAAFGGLAAVARARAAVAIEADALRALQRAVSAFDRDLGGARARPVRGNGGERHAALIGTPIAIELSTSAYASSATPTPALARVAWRLEGGALLRLRSPVLDRAPASPWTRQATLADVGALRLRYRSRSGVWRDDWPPRDGPEAGAESLPRAIEWRLQGEGIGSIVRVIELPDGPPAASATP